jgi:hypothetical protein
MRRQIKQRCLDEPTPYMQKQIKIGKCYAFSKPLQHSTFLKFDAKRKNAYNPISRVVHKSNTFHFNKKCG